MTFSVSYEVSKTTLTLLERLEVRLNMTYPEAYHPNIEQIRSNLFQVFGFGETTFTLVSENILPPEKIEEGLIKQTAVFTLAPKVAGTHSLTFLNIPFESTDHPLVTLMSEITTITIKEPVVTPLPEPQLMNFISNSSVSLSLSNRERFLEKRNKEALRNQELLQEKTIPLFEMTLLATGVIFAILALKSKKAFESRIKPVPDPKKMAINALNDLALKQPQIPEFYFRLTEIFLQFIQDRYKILIRSKTADELITIIPPLFPKKQEYLKQFILDADQIKFGLQPVTDKQIKDDFDLIKYFIQHS